MSMFPLPVRKAGAFRLTIILPGLFWLLALAALADPLSLWLSGESRFEQDAIKEWLEEARISRRTLPELIESYLRLAPAGAVTIDEGADIRWQSALVRREEIREHLRALGEPISKLYPEQLPLFPFLFRLEVVLDSEPREPIFWDCGVPFREQQAWRIEYKITPKSTVKVVYQLHAFDHRRILEKERLQRGRWLLFLAITVALGASLQAFWSFRRERSRRLQTELAREEAREAESLRLQAEKQLLSQQLLVKAAEKDALELRSQMYAGIGIMAGSYAHNIKNLLVRPLDLLRRCKDAPQQQPEVRDLLGEVEETLASVGERLSQILGTLRRSPDRYEPCQVDLGGLIRSIVESWKLLAGDKWKIDLSSEPMPTGDLCLQADPSHLQQVLENLLFNARDAIFELRTKMREEARQLALINPEAGRQALLKASLWRGNISIQLTRNQGDWVLAVRDNGAGMSAETLTRCTEAHYSTRRESAIYEGMSSGMGLGLSFVKTVLQRGGIQLQMESEPGKGTVIRMVFPKSSGTEPKNV